MSQFIGAQTKVPFQKYQTWEGVGITSLKELLRSPKHYWYRRSAPKESAALILGSAIHTAVLEPSRFIFDYAVWDRVDDEGKPAVRRGKAWDAFLAHNTDKRILRNDDYITAMACRDSVRSSPTAMQYLHSGDAEVSMQWKHELTGLYCKGRPDWLYKAEDGSVVLVGLKSSRDCRPIPFGNQAAKFAYHLQWAYYCDGWKQLTSKYPRVVEIVVESTPPHDVAVYRVPTEVIEAGRDKYNDLLRILAQCKQTNHWPGVANEEIEVTLPSWVYESESEDLADLELEA